MMSFNHIWTPCEIWRETFELGIATVIGLIPNSKILQKVNKRVVNRTFSGKLNIRCALTNELITKNEASAEHIIPLSKGGNSSIWNLCVTKETVNNKRSNEDFWEYKRLYKKRI